MTMSKQYENGFQALPARVRRMINWLVENQAAVVAPKNGHVAFHFGGGDLQVEIKQNCRVTNSGNTDRLNKS